MLQDIQLISIDYFSKECKVSRSSVEPKCQGLYSIPNSQCPADKKESSPSYFLKLLCCIVAFAPILQAKMAAFSQLYLRNTNE